MGKTEKNHFPIRQTVAACPIYFTPDYSSLKTDHSHFLEQRLLAVVDKALSVTVSLKHTHFKINVYVYLYILLSSVLDVLQIVYAQIYFETNRLINYSLKQTLFSVIRTTFTSAACSHKLVHGRMGTKAMSKCLSKLNGQWLEDM